MVGCISVGVVGGGRWVPRKGGGVEGGDRGARPLVSVAWWGGRTAMDDVWWCVIWRSPSQKKRGGGPLRVGGRDDVDGFDAWVDPPVLGMLCTVMSSPQPNPQWRMRASRILCQKRSDRLADAAKREGGRERFSFPSMGLRSVAGSLNRRCAFFRPVRVCRGLT